MMAPPTHFLPQNLWGLFKAKDVEPKPPMQSSEEPSEITGLAELTKEFETGPPPPRHHDPTPADLKAQRRAEKEAAHAEELKEKAKKCE
jgi:U1 small nuclear ribonucleoprotein of 70kDa MW N terminal